MGSCLCLSDDHSSFYVGYTLSGIVEKYSVASGALICSALAHCGDVHTLAEVRPDVLCTSGSDGQLRLVDMIKSNSSEAATTSVKPTASLSHDELVYKQMYNGVLSVRLIRPHIIKSQFQMIVCSSGAARLIGLRTSLRVQSFRTVASDNIGKCCTASRFYHIFLLIPSLHVK